MLNSADERLIMVVRAKDVMSVIEARPERLISEALETAKLQAGWAGIFVVNIPVLSRLGSNNTQSRIIKETIQRWREVGWEVTCYDSASSNPMYVFDATAASEYCSQD